MAQFHFVEDYRTHVRNLIAAHPLDEAMSLAVGGLYDVVGGIEADIAEHFGLRSGQAVVDLGCGSGRLAVALSKRVDIAYTGLDVVDDLLRYAETKCPPSYRFVLNQTLTIPLPDDAVDFAFSFSVFTHLLQSETYLYLEEMLRCLRSGGKVVCSFLEFTMASHWEVFKATVDAQRHSTNPHLNQFIERVQFEAWATHLGFDSVEFVSGDHAPWSSGMALGQSVAVLTKA